MEKAENKVQQGVVEQDDEDKTFVVRFEPIVLEIGHGSAEEAEREAYELVYSGEVSFKVASVTLATEPERLCRNCGHCSLTREECGAISPHSLRDLDRTLDSPGCSYWMERSPNPSPAPVAGGD